MTCPVMMKVGAGAHTNSQTDEYSARQAANREDELSPSHE